MRTIKFEYIHEHLRIDYETNRFEKYFIKEVLTLNDIENKIFSQTNIPIAKRQFTGLLDKINRNEVYEHDIINHIQYGFLKVEWDYRDTGWICLDKNFKKYYLTDILLLGGIRVGNIYEHPHLLNADFCCNRYEAKEQ